MSGPCCTNENTICPASAPQFHPLLKNKKSNPTQHDLYYCPGTYPVLFMLQSTKDIPQETAHHASLVIMDRVRVNLSAFGWRSAIRMNMSRTRVENSLINNTGNTGLKIVKANPATTSSGRMGEGNGKDKSAKCTTLVFLVEFPIPVNPKVMINEGLLDDLELDIGREDWQVRVPEEGGCRNKLRLEYFSLVIAAFTCLRNTLRSMTDTERESTIYRPTTREEPPTGHLRKLRWYIRALHLGPHAGAKVISHLRKTKKWTEPALRHPALRVETVVDHKDGVTWELTSNFRMLCPSRVPKKQWNNEAWRAAQGWRAWDKAGDVGHTLFTDEFFRSQ
ncbi:hypothetical protein BJY04DRAFT_214779 [Aspergillus karnatakaensis]|uniref:uncharacterized protein n=1 Tax=Aspergillus karnatakaensis TaxID=1810916 RepID=UPI003CCD5E84